MWGVGGYIGGCMWGVGGVWERYRRGIGEV